MTKALRPQRAASHHRFEAVPLLDLGRQYQSIRAQVLEAIERVCASQHFILGKEVEALEQEIAAFTSAAAGVGCASGSDALWLGLLALGVQPGDRVVTTPFSFHASASAIIRAGGRPVFADIDPGTLNLDPETVKTKLRSTAAHKFRVLLPVHLFGQCSDMDAFAQLAEGFSLSILEDSAQAIGARWRDRCAGSLGSVSAFSFYPTKNLSAFGDAGMVTTNRVDLAEHMRHLRNHGSSRRYYHEELGANSRMDAIQAAVLRVKLPHVQKWNQQRRERAAKYGLLLSEAGLFSTNSRSPVRPLAISPNAHHIFHQYVVRVEHRDELRNFLTGRHIGSEIYYPLPLHLQPCFAYLGYQPGDFPEAELAAREVLALPMFPELTEEEQRWVVESIAEFYS